jgi:hypothetical protein
MKFFKQLTTTRLLNQWMRESNKHLAAEAKGRMLTEDEVIRYCLRLLALAEVPELEVRQKALAVLGAIFTEAPANVFDEAEFELFMAGALPELHGLQTTKLKKRAA